jgi:hypothetical protein
LGKRFRLPVIYEANPNAIVIEPAKYRGGPNGDQNLVCGGCGEVLFERTTLTMLRLGWARPRGAGAAKCEACGKLVHIPDTPQPHPSFNEPPDTNVRIWRYMDLAKLLSILQRGAFFFPKASLLGDPFEGSTPKMNRILWDSIIELRKSHPDAPFVESFKDLTDAQITAMVDQFSHSRRDMVDKFLVSCWHMNEHESAAMWKLYTAANESICLQTTFNKLREQMPSWINIGMVNYIDYDKMIIGEGNAFNFITIKRHSFEHERELRAVAWSIAWEIANTDLRDGLALDGLWVDVDLSTLLDTIYISPTSPPWFADCVRSLVKKYELAVPVQQSALNVSPIY